MFDELTVRIHGRDALPVRAIPHITGWQLSPDEVAGQFARSIGKPFAKLQNTCAYRLKDGTPAKVLPKQWDVIVAELEGLEAEIRERNNKDKSGDNKGYAEWLATSVTKLPAGVFAWLDEFIADKPFGRKPLSEDSAREGDRELVDAPLLTNEQRQEMFKGLEAYWHEPDWNHWRDTDKVRIWEAPLLSLNRNPNNIDFDGVQWRGILTEENVNANTLPPELDEEYKQRLWLLLKALHSSQKYFPGDEHLGFPQLRDEVPLANFAAWCLLKELTIPAGLATIADTYGGVEHLREEAAERRKGECIGWWNEHLDANTYWQQTAVRYGDAAKLLSGHNPKNTSDDDANHNETIDDTRTMPLPITPKDYKRLRDEFAAQTHNETDRKLAYWLNVAQSKQLRYHGWIDEWLKAMGIEAAADESAADSHSQAEAQSATQQIDAASQQADNEHDEREPQQPDDAGTASSICGVFREMSELKPHEIHIDFAAGESGGVILNVSARCQSRRVPLAELGLIDRRNAGMNEQCGLLLGMAQEQTVTTSDNRRAKKVSRIRTLFKTHFGVGDDPFEPYKGQQRYTPLFKITDSRGAADERAKREAERNTVPYEDGHSYEPEDDEAGRWLDEQNKRG